MIDDRQEWTHFEHELLDKGCISDGRLASITTGIEMNCIVL